jgi:hypothetical protein
MRFQDAFPRFQSGLEIAARNRGGGDCSLRRDGGRVIFAMNPVSEQSRILLS